MDLEKDAAADACAHSDPAPAGPRQRTFAQDQPPWYADPPRAKIAAARPATARSRVGSGCECHTLVSAYA